jgi:hypothetical protein
MQKFEERKKEMKNVRDSLSGQTSNIVMILCEIDDADVPCPLKKGKYDWVAKSPTRNTNALSISYNSDPTKYYRLKKVEG